MFLRIITNPCVVKVQGKSAETFKFLHETHIKSSVVKGDHHYFELEKDCPLVQKNKEKLRRKDAILTAIAAALGCYWLLS